jgi:prepilin-type N-terminal cleavage/methylation domain-containing protein
MQLTIVAARLRNRIHKDGDAGWTLVELMATLVITSIALTLTMPIFSSVTRVIAQSNSSANASGQARNVLRQLASDVASTNQKNVCFPTTVQAATTSMPTCTIVAPVSGTSNPVVYAKASSGQYLLVLSSVNYGVSGCQWIQWSVDPTTQRLVQQSWAQASTTEPDSWSNPVPLVGYVSANVNSLPLFSLDTSIGIVTMDMTLQGSIGNSSNGSSFSIAQGSQAVELSTSVSVVQSTQPQDAC